MTKSQLLMKHFMMRRDVVVPAEIDKGSCFSAFESLISNSTDEAVAASYTKSVSYGRNELFSWLENECAEATRIEVTFGQYTQAFKDDVITVFNNPSLTSKVVVGRTTCILVAFKDNEELSAFDLGTLEP